MSWAQCDMFTRKAETEHIIQYYSGLLKKHGDDAKALDWGSRASQEVRFSVLTQIGNLNGFSVLDVGCGLADLYAFMEHRGINIDYMGCDITPQMIERARKRFPELRLEVLDILAEPEPTERFDFVLASGIFYLRWENPLAYLEAMVSRMFKLCRRGMAFNTLSTEAPQREPAEFHAEPIQVLEACMGITRNVVLRHDYLPNDFTVYLYRD